MIDYKKSGVDIEAGDHLVEWLQNSHQQSSQTENYKSDVPDYRQRVISGIGGFAALYDGAFKNMKSPVLVSCTDGVGTKLKLAVHFEDYSLIGQDLVAMCANDLICSGATPLFFLDYYATGQLDLKAAQSFLTSVRQACEKSHMALIGGETAEMPGLYHKKDFDCAGFSVGVVDREQMWGAHKVQSGDKLIALSSSGYHSNGYSLIRKLFENEFEKFRAWLMQPTELYIEAALSLKNSFEIHAAAHITGGGIENIPRVLPDNKKAKIRRWAFPECFVEVQKRSGLTEEQMLSTFNCGVGFVLIVKAEQAQEIVHKLNLMGHKSFELGEVVDRKPEESHVEWA